MCGRNILGEGEGDETGEWQDEEEERFEAGEWPKGEDKGIIGQVNISLVH